MIILLTGATGFIGTNLALRFLKEHHTVIGVDNFYTSHKSRLEVFKGFDKFIFIEHDIIQPLELASQLPHSLAHLKPTVICNFACPASPVHYLKDPVYTTKTSVDGIQNMLALANLYDIPLLHASTSEVYGDPLQHPQTEQYWGHVNPNGIRACYDEGKRVAETFCFDFKRIHNTKIRIIRIFNTYGPYMQAEDGRVVSNFIVQALQNIPLTVYGDGMQTRSFCYVDDLVDGIYKYATLSDPNNSKSGPINLGNPNEITINELVTQINKFLPNTKIINKPLPQDDPQQRKPNIDVAMATLKWQPKVSLQEGLEKTIAWFRQDLKKNSGSHATGNTHTQSRHSQN